MYIPEHFNELRPKALADFMRAHPLATLVISGSEGLCANHVPLSLRAEAGTKGRLLGHVSRANSLWREAGAGIDCLAVFRGPEHYISPNAYASKAVDGKVVPTWNYEVVHVHGIISAIDDPRWLRGFLDELTREHEASQVAPWSIDDAPAEYVERMMRGVVGLSIEIQSIVGKSKLSQNIPRQNQKSLVDALRDAGRARSDEMADAVLRANGERE